MVFWTLTLETGLMGSYPTSSVTSTSLLTKKREGRNSKKLTEMLNLLLSLIMYVIGTSCSMGMWMLCGWRTWTQWWMTTSSLLWQMGSGSVYRVIAPCSLRFIWISMSAESLSLHFSAMWCDIMYLHHLRLEICSMLPLRLFPAVGWFLWTPKTCDIPHIGRDGWSTDLAKYEEKHFHCDNHTCN